MSGRTKEEFRQSGGNVDAGAEGSLWILPSWSSIKAILPEQGFSSSVYLLQCPTLCTSPLALQGSQGSLATTSTGIFSYSSLLVASSHCQGTLTNLTTGISIHKTPDGTKAVRMPQASCPNLFMMARDTKTDLAIGFEADPRSEEAEEGGHGDRPERRIMRPW